MRRAGAKARPGSRPAANRTAAVGVAALWGLRCSRLLTTSPCGPAFARGGGSPAVASVEDLSVFKELRPHTWTTGRVHHRASYGIWVDVTPPEGQNGPPARGLVHITEALEAGDNYGTPGEEVQVRVVDVDTAKGHLSLSMRGQEELDLVSDAQAISAFDGVFACQWHPGRVHSFSDSGVLVDVVPLGGGRALRGLCPTTQVDGVADVDELRSHLRPGQEVHVRVVAAGGATGNELGLRLSMKGGAADIQADLEAQLQALERSVAHSEEEDRGNCVDEFQPLQHRTDRTEKVKGRDDSDVFKPLPDWQDLSAFERLPPSQWLVGTIHHIASFGIYVEVDLSGTSAAWGLVHITELKDAAKGHPAKLLKQGQEVHVRVLSADLKYGRLILSMREQPSAQEQLDSEEDRPDAHVADFAHVPASEWHDGVVLEVHPFGVYVNVLPPPDLTGGSAFRKGATPAHAPPVLGLVYITELDRYTDDPSSQFKIGDKVQVRMIDVACEPDGLLGLSMRRGTADIQADLDHQDGLSRARVGVRVSGPEQHNLENAGEKSAKSKDLRTFLDVAPSQWLYGVVQQSTPFGLLVIVAHPESGLTALGLLTEAEAGSPGQYHPGQGVQVHVATVDTHRGVLGLSLH